MQPEATTKLRSSLEALADVLDGVTFRLPSPDLVPRELERRDLVRSIREYLLPRLRDPEAPVVAALFGPTGSGKSTILNSLAQARIGTPGVVRPATLAPVVWAHRDHASRYWAEFVARVKERAGSSVEIVVGADPLTKDLTIIDTPPFDFVSDQHRVVSQEVLSIADLCVFVASPLRYADGDAWDFIRHAQRRGLPILFVMNRLPADEGQRQALLVHYASRLADAGLLLDADPSLLFAVADQELDAKSGALPPGSVATLRRELEEFADAELRHDLVNQATEGAVFELADHAGRIAKLVEEELQQASDLLRAVEDVYTEEAQRMVEELGTVRGGGFGPEALRRQLAAVTTRRIGTAAQSASSRWAANSVGSALLDTTGQGLWRHGPHTPDRVTASLEDWADDVVRLARERSMRRLRRRGLRKAATELQAASLAGEGPTPLLRKRFGDTAESVISTARIKLVVELQELFSQDARRFVSALGDLALLERASDVIAEEAARLREFADAAAG